MQILLSSHFWFGEWEGKLNWVREGRERGDWEGEDCSLELVEVCQPDCERDGLLTR